MSESVKLEIDLSSGKIQVECAATSLDAVLQKVEGLLPKLSTAKGAVVFPKPAPLRDAGSTTSVSAQLGDKPTRPKRKAGVYEMVRLGLTMDQARALNDFYKEKNPKSQNDQILVVMYWLAQELDRKVVDADEIFTAIRNVANAKAPARIESVMSNLVMDNKAARDGNGKIRLTHIGEDYVTKDLPAGK